MLRVLSLGAGVQSTGMVVMGENRISTKTSVIALRMEDDLIERLDRWRTSQTVPPSRAAAIRYLVAEGLNAGVAQSVEQPICNRPVDGSSPSASINVAIL